MYEITSKKQYEKLMQEYYGKDPKTVWKRGPRKRKKHPATLDGEPFYDVVEGMTAWLKKYPSYEEMPDGV